MKTAAIALSALALASQVSAVLISYSQPIAATQWTAGKSATVSWSNSCNDIQGNTTFPITLNEEVNTLQVEVPGVGPIGYLDCKKAGSTTVQIPATLPQGIKYSILVTNGGNQSYSALFTILSTVPGPNTTTTTTTALPMTTSAAVTATISSPASVTSSTSVPTNSNNAGALKAGSTVALVIVAAVGSLML
ncbi:hypothetical protein BGX28_001526 [Mortierella sp. GBA30]|nr:hypothetical protein BGX28_001526 [Mortierella sp. GBA30]